MNLLAVLEYDGTHFVGFQKQKRGRTIQAEVEQALAEFNGKPVRIVGGGRTDAGVHAAGQTASFTVDWTRDLDTLLRALNAKLPSDIAVRQLRAVPPGFSARYSAIARLYEYRIFNSPVRSALVGRYALWVPVPLDAESMGAAARFLVGRMDFGAFGTPPRGENTVREMQLAEVRRQDEFVLIRLQASAFLYRMVRRIVGSLLQVGRVEVSIEQFREVLSRERRAGASVPPQGLTLLAVNYDPAVLAAGS